MDAGHAVPLTEDQLRLRDMCVEAGEDPVAAEMTVARLTPAETESSLRTLTIAASVKSNVPEAERPEAFVRAYMADDGDAGGTEAVARVVGDMVRAQDFVFDGNRACFARTEVLRAPHPDPTFAPAVTELLGLLADYVGNGGEVDPKRFSGFAARRFGTIAGGIFIFALQVQGLPPSVVSFLQACLKELSKEVAAEGQRVLAQRTAFK